MMQGPREKEIGVGVVGCGDWGPNLGRCVDALPGSSVRWVCDQSDDRLQHLGELYPRAKGVKDFGLLLEDNELDAIVIATPVTHHYAMAKASLLAGKHTFVEKPLARSSAECEELIELARRKRLILMVGHTFLYSLAVRKITELVRTGVIGEIQYIFARRLSLGLFQKDINVAWDLAPHDISIILQLLGQSPTTVNCLGSAHVTEGIEDITNMTLTFGDGRSATIQSSWLHPRKVREMTIVGARRMIVYNDVEPMEKIKIYDSRVHRPPHCDTVGEFHYAYQYGDRRIPHIAHEEPLKVECQHFLDCVSSGTEPISNGLHGLELVRVLEASSASLRYEGASVDLEGRLSRKPLEASHAGGHPPVNSPYAKAS